MGMGVKEKDVSNRDRVRSVLVSFNGQKYDVNVLKDELLWILIEEDPASEVGSKVIRFTIKSNSSTACFESADLRFVNIPLTNFIAPDSNYAGYLKAFRVGGSLSITGLIHSKYLKFESHPPQEAFYSKLKQECTCKSDED